MTISHRNPTNQEIVAELKDIRADLDALDTGYTGSHRIPLRSCYKDGAMKDVVDDAAGASLLGLADTPGSVLTGNAANANSKSDYAGFAFALPDNYVPGGAVTVRLTAKIATALAFASSKVDVEAKLVGSDGTLGSDICATAAQQVTTAYADYDFTITPTGLVAGDVLHFRVATLNDDTGGSNNKAMSISRIWVLCAQYGALGTAST